MANREENLKKINENLEQLTDEQLEDIAGSGLSALLWNHSYNRIGTDTPVKGNGVNVEPKKNIEIKAAVAWL